MAELFADAAIRAKKAGFDGIEVCANHHVSLSQFLSPMFNQRTDEYGGSDENRARFVIEIIKKIREKIGDEYIILLKLNSEDDDPHGTNYKIISIQILIFFKVLEFLFYWVCFILEFKKYEKFF